MAPETFRGVVLREMPNGVATSLRLIWFAGTLALIPILYLQLLSWNLATAVGVGWFVYSFGAIPLLRRFSRKPSRQEVRLLVDADGIHADGKRIVARERLQSGAIATGPDGALRVVLAYRNAFGAPHQPLELRLVPSDAEQGDAIIRAAGLGATQNVFTARHFQPNGFVFAGLFGVYVCLALLFTKVSWAVFGVPKGPVGAAAPILAAGAIAGGLFALLTRISLIVGRDGIAVHRAFRKRFYAFAQIRNVAFDAKTVCIELTGGEVVPILGRAWPEPVGSFDATDGIMSLALLGTRLQEALSQRRERGQPGATHAALARNRRSIDEWYEALRTVATGACGYRTGVVHVEELQRLVADATAAREVRVGAAVALRIAEGDDASSRIRVASEATAAPELRDVLRTIANEGDDAALRRQLGRVA